MKFTAVVGASLRSGYARPPPHAAQGHLQQTSIILSEKGVPLRRRSGVPFERRLTGPSIDFEIGRVYSAVLWYVDDGLRDRDTWLHQKKDPSAPPVEPEVVQMRAEQQYMDKNCALLAP